MESDGTYRKGRRRITQPVTHVSPDKAPPAPRHPDAPVARAHDSSGGVVFVNRFTGWTIAGLFVAILGAVAYLGVNFFTRAHQIEHALEELDETNRGLERTRGQVQQLERRQVELETDVENLQERR